MNIATIEQLLTTWLQPNRNQLDHLLLHAPALRIPALLMVHASGCLLMLAAPLSVAGSTGGALYLYYHIQGPLDWFLIEVLVTLGLFSAYLCLQLSALQPKPPHGVDVCNAQAPTLFASLARRTAHFKMRPVRHVLLTTDVELRIVATPVLPVPFVHRYTLCIGAPLTFFFSRGQFGLALAGAVAAAADGQSRLTGQLVQACADWQVILAALESRNNLLARLLARPLSLVAAGADRLSEPLRSDWRRQQSHWLREHCDEQNTIDYLANQTVAAAFMQKQYWPMILKSAERCPTPVVKAFSHLPLLLEKTLNQSLAERWLLQAQTAGEASEPHMRDLLAELRIDHLHWSGLPHPKAFGALFKSVGILKQLDTCWQQAIEPEWRRRHAHFQDDQARFQQLHKRAGDSGLRDESALRYIKLCARFLKPADALTACRQMYDSNRDDPKVCFAAGLTLLRTGGGQEGTDALQRAAELDPALANRAHALVNEHRQSWVRTDAGGPAPHETPFQRPACQS